MTRAVILAAGMGSRLSPYNDLPKCLTLLKNGQTLLGRQLEALKGMEVTVVVGFHEEMICEAFPQLKTVYSPRFAEQNTAKSLLLSLNGLSEDLLWINGDVVFNPFIISRIQKLNQTCMVVNRAAIGEEEVKYTVDGKGCINRVSKEVPQGLGEAVGINFFKASDLPLLKKGLEKCQERDYFEKGVEYSIGEGVHVYPLEINLDECVEVDFPQDLIRANQLTESF